jgi:hypothetical protein
MPSADLVIVRLAVTQQWPDFDIADDNRLIHAVLATLGPLPRAACAGPRR